MTWFSSFLSCLLTKCPDLQPVLTCSKLFYRPFDVGEVDKVFNDFIKTKTIDFEFNTIIF